MNATDIPHLRAQYAPANADDVDSATPDPQ